MEKSLFCIGISFAGANYHFTDANWKKPILRRHFLTQAKNPNCKGSDWSYCMWSCSFAYDIFVIWSCRIAGPVGIAPKRLKYLFVLSFRYPAVVLIIWDLSWHLSNYDVLRSYLVIHVNEVQNAAQTEFLCENGNNYLCFSLTLEMKTFLYWESEFSLENQIAWRSDLPMMCIINMTPKNKITTQKNLIDMKQMTLNDPKFDIKKSLDTLLYPLQYAKWLSKQQGKQQLCIHLLYESWVEQCEYTTQPKCSFWYHAIDAKGAVLLVIL